MVRSLFSMLVSGGALAMAVPAFAQAPAAQPAPAPAIPYRVLANVGFEGSESARYDAADDRYLVGNLGPRGAGNDGFISIVAPDGTVTNAKWIQGGRPGVGLRDPLGIFVQGDTLYVADTTAIRMFDRRTGAPTRSVEVPGAVRLNDLFVTAEGVIYITDSGNDRNPGALFRIDRAGRPSVFAARDPALERPNGIAVMADGTVVHGGRGVNLVFRTPQGRIIREATLPSGQFDGIVPLEDGSLLVASQLGRNVYRVAPDGAATVVAENIEVPAAIGYDPKRRRILIPQIRASSLTFVDLP